MRYWAFQVYFCNWEHLLSTHPPSRDEWSNAASACFWCRGAAPVVQVWCATTLNLKLPLPISQWVRQALRPAVFTRSHACLPTLADLMCNIARRCYEWVSLAPHLYVVILCLAQAVKFAAAPPTSAWCKNMTQITPVVSIAVYPAGWWTWINFQFKVNDHARALTHTSILAFVSISAALAPAVKDQCEG